MQALFGEGFLATVTSWVVGFIVALIFAGLSYLFWFAAVAIAGGSLGYSVAVGILLAIGLQMGFLVWIVGVAAFVVVAFLTLALNLQKWIVEIATAVMGAAATIGVFVLLGNPAADYCGIPFSPPYGVAVPDAHLHHPGDRGYRLPGAEQPQLRGRAVQPHGGADSSLASLAIGQTGVRRPALV